MLQLEQQAAQADVSTDLQNQRAKELDQDAKSGKGNEVGMIPTSDTRKSAQPAGSSVADPLVNPNAASSQDELVREQYLEEEAESYDISSLFPSDHPFERQGIRASNLAIWPFKTGPERLTVVINLESEAKDIKLEWDADEKLFWISYHVLAPSADIVFKNLALPLDRKVFNQYWDQDAKATKVFEYELQYPKGATYLLNHIVLNTTVFVSFLYITAHGRQTA